MIKISGLIKTYGNYNVLNDINMEISKPGIYVINGISGSGKSTLINIIGLMDEEYQGDYRLFSKNVKKLNEEEKALIRFNQIAYIYQNPKFLENENILTNINLGVGKKIEINQIKEVLNILNLKVKLKKKVSLLSGGERKRLGIAIALLKDTPLLLCDEITVGLDSENKKKVMDILIAKSRSKIILLVTHDISFIKEYTENIYKIENKTIPEISSLGNIYENEVNKKNKISDSFLKKHIFNHIQNKVGRTLICILSLVIALVSLGLSLLLTSSLSKSVTNSLNGNINESQIVVSKKNQNDFLIDSSVIDKSDMKIIKGKYNYFFDFESVKYLNDLDKFFVDENYFTLNINHQMITLNKYKVNTFSNFTYFLEDEENFIYTYNFDLQEDEIIISLTDNQVYSFCKELGIEYKNETSLLPYFKDNVFLGELYLKNDSWEYELEVPMKVVGYTVSSEARVYHSDSKWNEYLIERVLQLPFSYNLSVVDKFPWTTKKIHYFSLTKNKEFEFLQTFLKDKEMIDYRYSIFKGEEGYNVFFYYRHDDSFNHHEIESIIDENIDSFIACSSSGYGVIESALLQGFYFPTYLSNQYNLLEEYIDYNTYSASNLGAYQSTILNVTNEELFSLNMLDSTKDNFISIKPFINQNKSIKGNYPKRYNEVIISSGLADKLHINNEVFSEKPLYMLLLKDVEYANSKYKNIFEIVEIYVCGIIEDSKSYLYVDSYWPTIFLSIALEKSHNDYLTTSLVLNYLGDDITTSIKNLNEKHPKYLFSNPFLDYKKKVDETIEYLNLGLIIFSSFCLFSALLMVIISSYLFIVDTKKEIGIYTFYGYKKRSIEKQFRMFSTFLSGYASFLSTICLIVIMKMLNDGLLGLKVPFSLDSFLPFILINVISFIIGDISSYISTRKILKESPLRQLQEN